MKKSLAASTTPFHPYCSLPFLLYLHTVIITAQPCTFQWLIKLHLIPTAALTVLFTSYFSSLKKTALNSPVKSPSAVFLFFTNTWFLFLSHSLWPLFCQERAEKSDTSSLKHHCCKKRVQFFSIERRKER